MVLRTLLLYSVSWRVLAQAPELPAAIVLVPGGAEIIAAGTESALAARPFDALFPGDRIVNQGPPVTLAVCATRTAGDVTGDAFIEAGRIRGSVTPRGAGACPGVALARRIAPAGRHLTPGDVAALNAPPPLPDAVRDEVKPILDELARAESVDLRLAAAALFERNSRPLEAAEHYAKTGIDRYRERAHRLREAGERSLKAGRAPGDARTNAVLLGVSERPAEMPPASTIHFAHLDARRLAEFLESPRGGGRPGTVQALLNGAATLYAARDRLKHAAELTGPDDTLVVHAAAHGFNYGSARDASFLLMADSSLNEPGSSSLSLPEIFALLAPVKARRILIFLDACRTRLEDKDAGVRARVYERLKDLAAMELRSPTLVLMGCSVNEKSEESAALGGGLEPGAGLFSHYLTEGLRGAAGDRVTAGSLFDFVFDNVRREAKKQRPERIELNGMDSEHVLLEPPKPATLLDSRGDRVLVTAAQIPGLPGAAGRQAELEARRAARVDHENRGQQVIVEYLHGDRLAPARDRFEFCAGEFAAAARLAPSSLLLAGRQAFCEGRALLFRGAADRLPEAQFRRARARLEDAIRLDPGGAYAYNALGIAWLENGQYDRAIAAFQDAIARARAWAYPRLNLALALTERGSHNDVVAAYRQAIRLSPANGFLEFNLGLLYQRMNRRGDAEAAYRRAIPQPGAEYPGGAPRLAEVYNALGALRASGRRPMDAAWFYQQAKTLDPRSVTPGYNLALLYLRSGRDADPARALAELDRNLTLDAEHLPTLIQRAIALNAAGRGADAIAAWEAVLKRRPDYPAAREALDRLRSRPRR
ncbi:MAG: tetratricopeptide repeat protein [Acidobacteria bacterium]|nr:tetratricopeptide repeat protein [Acidobacteriota bacterium]